jgi:transposase
MSLQAQGLEPIPEATRRLAQKSRPKGTAIMRLRDALGPIYQDETFAELFPRRGRPAEAPWRLALVTVFQAMENLTDRQAAQMVALRMDWKYALSLEPEDEGFDYSVLSQFRQRLIDHGAEDLVLEPLLAVCREHGWLKAGGKQRTDSTHVLAAVRALSSLESVGEALRAALNTLSELEPQWLLLHIEDDWFDRYVHRFELARFPKGQSQREQVQQQVGRDAQRLLQASEQPDAPAAVRALPEVHLLRQIWQQHYEEVDGEARWRDGPAVSSAERVVSPYDVQARSARKRDTDWMGYKSHLTETCEEEPDALHLIVHVETTLATTEDHEVLAPLLDQERQQGRAPEEMYVDMGYTSGPLLVQQASLGTRLIGPVAISSSWQQREQRGFAPHDFALDWEKQVAHCPQGQPSQRWSQAHDKRGKPITVIQFAKAVCQACPVRSCCTRSPDGRSLTLAREPVQQALEQRRREQITPAFQQQYALRAGVEATISQGVRTKGLRQARYRGQDKVHLHHLRIAAAINFVRIDQWLQAHEQGRPARRPRPLSRFGQLQQRKAS